MNVVVVYLGVRKTVVIGALLMALSAILASAASQLMLIVCLMGILLGTVNSCAVAVCLVCLSLSVGVVCLSLCLSVGLVCLSLCLSVSLSVCRCCLSVCLFVCLSVLSVCLSLCLRVGLVCLSVSVCRSCLSVSSSVGRSLSVCLSVCLSLSLSLSVSLSVSLSLSLSLCLPHSSVSPSLSVNWYLLININSSKYMFTHSYTSSCYLVIHSFIHLFSRSFID